MNDQLETTVSQAVDGLHVPEFDFAAVVRRTHADHPVRKTRRRAPWLALLAIAVPAAAFGATVLPSAQLRAEIARYFHFQPGVPVTWQQQTQITTSQARTHAAFDLRLPSGLPDGTRLVKVFQNGNAGTSYAAQYALPNGRTVTFSLDKARPHARYLGWIVAIDLDARGRVTGSRQVPVRIWIAGDEAVTVAAGALTPRQLAAVEKAMGGHDAAPVPLAKPQR